MNTFHNLNKMSKIYDENVHIFYPQKDNLYYTESKAMKIALRWLIEACKNNENQDFKKELRALLSTTSNKVHKIANMIRYVISLDKNDSKSLDQCNIISLHGQAIILRDSMLMI